MAIPTMTHREKRRIARDLLKTMELLMKERWMRVDNVIGKLHRDEHFVGLERKPSGKNRITLTIEYTDTRRNPR